jgi:hypothetical protein
MKKALLLSTFACVALALSGCESKDDDDGFGGGGSSSGGGGDGTGDGGGDDGGDDGADDGGDDGTGGDDGSDDGDGGTGDGATGDDGGDSSGGVFIQEPDGGGADMECDVWAQDCQDGEKCMPWANDGGNAWNATKCSPLDQNPMQPGDTCTVEGSRVSGVDNCDVASMCWNVDPETGTGTCVAFCTGTEAAPVCEDPGTSCSITNEGVLILCLTLCDPLLQDCPEGEACYPVLEDMLCGPDASGPDAGVAGDPCEYINACDPGLAGINAEYVPGCAGATACCAPFCDVNEAECDAGAGEECVPYYEEGQAPPGYENVGICMLPP